MNFYRKFCGDYLADTGHLNLAENGAYSLMLDHFYATEKPLPKPPALYRLLRCESDLERQAVDNVVQQYWKSEKGGLVNHKAKKEIERAEKMRDRNKVNGKKGGRPPKGETHDE